MKISCGRKWSDMPRNLRELARDRACYLRLEGVCNFDAKTTVLAHIRRGSIAGTGMKPPDICAVPICSACHDVIDRRVQSRYSRSEIDAELLRALVQWQAWLWNQEILLVVA